MFRASTGTNCHRRESPWLGRSVRWTSRVRGLERPSLISVVERTRNARDSNGFEGVFQSDTRKEHSSSNRQHFCDGLREPQGWSEPSSFKVSKGHLGRGDRDWCLDKVRAYSRSRDPGVRLLVQEGRQTQLEASSQTFCLPGPFMGSTHSRQIRELSKYTASAIQQQVLGAVVRSGRRVVPGQLGFRKQFCERTVLPTAQSFRRNSRSARSSNSYCAKMVSSTVVQSSAKYGSRTAVKAPEQPKGMSSDGCGRAVPEPEVVPICLEGMWQSDLKQKGWSADCIEKFQYCIAPSTLNSYNGALEKLYVFCKDKSCAFPPIDVRILAEFLATVAEKSARPRSVLNTTTAALGHMYRALDLPNVIERYEIRMFITALVKSGTSVPMLRSKAMPVGHFHDLFMNWADNDALDLKSLRLKAITLLALTAMLRPSDIAPNARQLNSHGECRVVFSVNQLIFSKHDVKITFFGIKNDTARTGFDVQIPRSRNDKVDPVQTLLNNILRAQILIGRPTGRFF